MHKQIFMNILFENLIQLRNKIIKTHKHIYLVMAKFNQQYLDLKYSDI